MLEKKNNLNNNFLTFSKKIIFSGISSIFIALPVLAERKPDFVVSIKQLSYEFERNSIVAEDKYMNKVIKTNGIITKIDDTLLGDRWVSVGIKDPESDDFDFLPATISCLHVRSEPIIRELYKGQKVDITGKITEEELGLTLKYCSYEIIRTSKEWKEIYYRKWKEKDFKGVIYAASKFIELNPKDSTALNDRGTAKIQLEDYEGAINDLDKSIKLYPKSDAAFINRSYAKSSLGDYEGSIDDLDKAIKLNPKSGYFFLRGVKKFVLEDYEEAINDFNKAIKLNPKDGKSFYGLGNAKKKLGDQKGACSDWRKASELGNKNAVNQVKDKCN